MRRMAAALMMTGAAWMGLSGEARAQVLIMPTGPLSLTIPAVGSSCDFLGLASDDDKLYPGRTMGGGNRFLRSNPPPSYFRRRKE